MSTKKICTQGISASAAVLGTYLIDAIFRNGKAHSSHGNHVIRMISTIVRLIRRSYRLSVPIVLVADSGFCRR